MRMPGICLGIFAILLLAVLFIRIKVGISFDESGFKAQLKILFYRLKLPPEKRNKKPAKEGEKPAKPRKKGKFSDFTDIITTALETLPRVVTSIRIDDLRADVTVASDDAAKTAMLYGSLASGCGIILPVLENNFKIKKKKVHVEASFETSEMQLLLEAGVSVAVWQIIVIVLVFFKKYISKKGRNDK